MIKVRIDALEGKSEEPVGGLKAASIAVSSWKYGSLSLSRCNVSCGLSGSSASHAVRRKVSLR
jgi:hypothetical protein